ncbi:hypothetical protein [Planococcus sp. YIM B11945]|uniref:hypothetical protein n=1 Tax=Planococcus sp. YIM B11945 TaxID=3435410 RepID=UPI003D7D6EB9
MANKSHGLKCGWTLIAHKSFKLFSNDNAYVVIDEDSDVVMHFTVKESEFEVIRNNWGLTYKVIPGFKTIKFMNVPEEEEE